MTEIDVAAGVDEPATADQEPVRFLGSKIRRRTFLGGVAAAGAGAALASRMAPASASGRVVRALSAASPVSSGTVAVTEQVYNAVCSPNCSQTCHLESHVLNGRLIKTAMNPLPNTRYNRICLRGLSHAQWVYNPARLKYPMKRVGARGSGKWQRISWDQATSEIADKIQAIQSKYGKKGFAVCAGSGNYGAVQGAFGYAPTAFGNILEATSLQLAVDQAVTLGEGQVGFSGFATGNDTLDISNADLVIMWGNNMTESGVQGWHFVADALDRGAQLVVIDPNFSTAASKATKWIPLRPGSDPAFGLSVLNVLIGEELYDKDFVVKSTTLPFLVREDDGMFLRDAANNILVWDPATKSAQPADHVTSPVLTGTYNSGGVTVRPAFQLLADRVSTWTPEYTRQFTEVDPADVRWLARTYAGTKKSFLYPSMGIDRWDNGFLNGRNLATMAALTHNFGQSGASLGTGAAALFLVYYSGATLFAPSGTYAAPLPLWQAFEAIDTGTTHILAPLDGKDPSKGVTKDPVAVPWTIKGVWFNHINVVSNVQQSKRFLKLLTDESKLELVVVSDSLPTDSVRYADYVLPAAHWLETDDVVGGGSHPYFMKLEQAVQPQFEAKGDYDIYKMVASKLGFGQYYTKTPVQMADTLVRAIGKKLIGGSAGDTFISTYLQKGVAPAFPPDLVASPGPNPVFSTPTGRLEPYSERVVVNYPPEGWIPVSAGVDPLPYWQAPIEAWPDNPKHSQYPLVYMQEHSRWRVHTTYFDQPWLREVNPQPYVDISAADARARGIQQGDYVEVFNDHGKTTAVARVSGKMRPGMVNLPKGWQRFQTKDDSGYSDVTNNWINKLTSNGSFFDNLVEVRKVDV